VAVVLLGMLVIGSLSMKNAPAGFDRSEVDALKFLGG